MSPINTSFQSAEQTKENIKKYLEGGLKDQNITSLQFANRANLSASEVSKIKNGLRHNLAAKTFYSLYSGFGHSCESAVEHIYPNMDLTMKPYVSRLRSNFGKAVELYERSKNSIEEISAKTGIDLNRLKELYFEQGAPETQELLLIERAFGLKMGTLFSKLFKPASIKKK